MSPRSCWKARIEWGQSLAGLVERPCLGWNLMLWSRMMQGETANSAPVLLLEVSPRRYP